MKNYLVSENQIDVTAGGAITSGEAALIGGILGVASKSGVSGDVIPYLVTGVFYLPKTTAEAWTQGAVLYWDNTTKKLTTTAASNKLVGCAYAAALAADTFGYCRLNGIAVA